MVTLNRRFFVAQGWMILTILVAVTVEEVTGRGTGMSSKKGKKSPKKSGQQKPAISILEEVVEAVGGMGALTNLRFLEITASGSTLVSFEDATLRSISWQPVLTNASTLLTLVNSKFRVNEEHVSLVEFASTINPSTYRRVVDGSLFNPHIMLLVQALEESYPVSYSGSDNRNKIVTITEPTISFGAASLDVYVDKKSHLISKIVTIESHPLIRDTTTKVHNQDWNLDESNSILFPETVTLLSGPNESKSWEERRTNVKVEPAIDDSFFALPVGTNEDSFVPDDYVLGLQNEAMVSTIFQLGIPYPFDRRRGDAMELAPGVMLIPSSSGPNSMVISHSGGLIVLDAAISELRSVDLLETIQEEFPDKEVTHIIQTHHHFDHSAGIRELVARTGATAIVGHGVKDLFERVLAAPSTVRPDTMANLGGTHGYVVEVEENGGLLVVEEGGLVVSALHTYRDPYAADAVLSLIESGGQRFVYAAYMYNATVIGGPQVLFDALRDKKIINADCSSEVPLTIVPAHGFATTLEKALEDLSLRGIDVGC